MRTVTLLALAEADLAAAWRGRPLDSLVAARPGGRLAALLAEPIDGLVVDGSRAATAALAGLGPPARRRVFDALVEDLAAEVLWHAPAPALSEVFAAIARAGGGAELEAAHLDGGAEPAYPPDLLEPPGASGPMSIGGKVGWVRWIDDTRLAASAAAAARRVASLPSGALPAANPTLFADLLAALLPLLDAAARPGGSLLASRW